MVTGKPSSSVCPHQPVFARDFLLRIGPEGIRKWRRFGDEVVPHGLLVCAGRTDEDELAGAAAKEFEVAFDVRGFEGDPVHDGIEGLARKRTGDRGRIVDIGGDGSDSGRNSADPKPAIEHRELDATFDGQIGAGAADDPGPSDEEHSHEESCIRLELTDTYKTGNRVLCVAGLRKSEIVRSNRPSTGWYAALVWCATSLSEPVRCSARQAGALHACCCPARRCCCRFDAIQREPSDEWSYRSPCLQNGRRCEGNPSVALRYD